MPETCVVCGDPVFLHVDQRPFCECHAEVVLREIERTIDHLKRSQWSSFVTRFATIGEVCSYTISRKDR